MVNLTIDDKQVTVPKEATIFDAAKAAGIRIPILCHDKKLHPFGGCRMCLVEVEQMKGRQIPACTTPVTEGMIVRTTTDEIINARKLVLELLLVKHPLDCPVCDAAGDCDLQNLTYEYQVNSNRFTDEKFQHKIDYENPLIERDMNRCILCGKCARICDEIVCQGAYSVLNRGLEAKIGTEFDGPLNCEFCGSCISVCPVGALISRPFKFQARWWALKKVNTVCSYCGTGCQLTLGVKDNKVLTTIYDEDQGFHNGQLCTRGRFGYQFINSDKRLTTPLIRKDGKLVTATWEEALGLVAEKLINAKNNGSQTFAGLVTPRITNEELYLFGKLVKDVIGSDNIDHSCGYAHSALSKGLQESLGCTSSPSTITDIQKTDFLLVVKSDTYETHPVIGFEINLGVKNKGVDLRIISDKKGKLSKLPKAITYLHNPGCELSLFNAIAKVIIDENLTSATITDIAGYEDLKTSLTSYTPENVASICGISVEEIKVLARDYAKAEKALILMPIGLGYPGHDSTLAQAVANLAVLTGRVDKEGSGLLVMGEKNNSQGAVDMGSYPTSGGNNALEILTGCASGAIKTLYVVGENPVVSYPNRQKVETALEKVDFLIVQDLFLTETAQKADVVLPACSFAEKNGTFTSVGRVVQRVNKAINVIGQARSDFDIFASLIKSIDSSLNIGNISEVFSEITKAIPSYSGLTFDGLGDHGALLKISTKEKLTKVDASNVTRREGQLALLTGSALYHCGTMSLYGEGPMAVCPEGYAEISRDDAATMKITENDTLKIKSLTGELSLKVKISPRIPKGVIFAPYHFAEKSVNILTDGQPVTWVTINK
jgi:NADH-quinone oxidoreductase chain G